MLADGSLADERISAKLARQRMDYKIRI